MLETLGLRSLFDQSQLLQDRHGTADVPEQYV